MDFLQTHTSDQTFEGRPLTRLFNMLRPDKKDIGYIYIYAIFNGLVNLTLPLGIQAIIGLIMGGAQISTSWIILVAVVIVGVGFTGGLQIMQLYITEMLQRRIFARSSFEFAHRIPLFKSEFVNKYYPPELINRFFDTLTIQKGLPKLLIDFSSSAIQIIFGLILLSFYHPFFVFFGVLLVLILVLIFRFTGPQGLETSLKESKYKYGVAYWLEELARTMSTFKLTGNSPLGLNKVDGLVSKYLTFRRKHFNVLVFQYGSIVLFKVLITAGLLVLGSILVVNQEINIGQFVASEIVILIVISSVEKLILSMETIYDVLTATEKIGAVTDLPIEEDTGIRFNEVDDNGGMHIRSKDLSYRYGGQQGPSLQEIAFDIQPGERVCVNGFNGSGKSTLANLISGMMTNFTGELVYNGIPQGNFCMTSLRSYIGDVLPQEDLFEATVAENITMGKESISVAEVRWAADQVGLLPYIQSLPDGFDTAIIAEGKAFPRSVARKVKLARAIVTKPKLLVLEEFMHNLERSERLHVANLVTNREYPWTVIGVSNDSEFAKRCDKILILKEGKLLDSGTYDEIKSKSYFNELFI